MHVSNTKQLSEQLGEAHRKLAAVIELLDEIVTPGLPDRFAEALYAFGVKQSQSVSYAESLAAWKKTAKEDMENASRTFGAMIHVVDSAEHRAPRPGVIEFME